MSVTVSVAGSNYTIPQTKERGWGSNVTSWIQAVSSNTLQKNGGNFTLTADTNFGATFGLLAKYFTSVSSNPAASGVFRLANAESVGWRNAGNSADLLLNVNASNQLTFNGNQVLDATIGLSNPMATTGDTIYGGASGVVTKLVGNTTTTKKFLTQTGNGSVSAAPAWSQPASTDLSDVSTLVTLTGAQTVTGKTGLSVGTSSNNIWGDSGTAVDVFSGAAAGSGGAGILEIGRTNATIADTGSVAKILFLNSSANMLARIDVTQSGTAGTSAAMTVKIANAGVLSTPLSIDRTGAITLSSSLTIGGNTTSDANLGTISSVTNSSYYVGSFSLTFSGPWTNQAVTINYVKIGNLVTLRIPDLLGTSITGAASTVVSTTGIPSGLRPASAGGLNFFAAARDNSANLLNPGSVALSTAGIITFTKDLVGNVWTNGGNAGVYGVTITYPT